MDLREFERVRCPYCRQIKVDLLSVTPISGGGGIVNCRCLSCEEVFGLPVKVSKGAAPVAPLLTGKMSRGYERASVA